MTRFFPSIWATNTLRYPLARHQKHRWIEAETPNGSVYRTYDSGGKMTRWALEFINVPSTQRQALDEFFDDCKGTFRSFVFLDPFENLVRQSEAFEDGVWEKQPGIFVSPYAPDPYSGTQARRVSNVSSTPQSLLQTLVIPGWFSYTASCWLRSSDTATAELRAHPTNEDSVETFSLSGSWQRYSINVCHESQTDAIHTGIRIPGNTEIFAYGFQLEQFSILSPYKRTTNASGVFADCRFDNDVIRWTTTGIDHHTSRVLVNGRMSE